MIHRAHPPPAQSVDQEGLLVTKELDCIVEGLRMKRFLNFYFMEIRIPSNYSVTSTQTKSAIIVRKQINLLHIKSN